MKDKEKQLVNEIKQGFKMHEEKHKQIEEMANFIHRTEFVDISRYEEETIAKELLKHYQPKLPEDSVVLTMQEWKQIKNSLYYSKEELEKKLQKARKETAEKFLNMIYWKAVKHIKGKNKDECFIEMSFEKLDELAKQFGVEIKEN